MKCEWDRGSFWAASVGSFCPQESLLLLALCCPPGTTGRRGTQTAPFFPTLGSSFLSFGLGAASYWGGSRWGWLVGWVGRVGVGDPVSSTWPYS